MNPRNVLMDRRKNEWLFPFNSVFNSQRLSKSKFNKISKIHFAKYRKPNFEWFHHRISSTDSKVRTTLETQSLTLAMKGLNAG